MRTNCLNTRAPSRRSPVSAEAKLAAVRNGKDDGISALSFDAYLIKWTNHEYDIKTSQRETFESYRPILISNFRYGAPLLL
jgi:hypothetical protein